MSTIFRVVSFLWIPCLSYAAKEGFCAPPPKIERATFSVPSEGEYKVGTVVVYTCNFGFVDDGNKRVSECTTRDNPSEAFWTEPDIACNPRSCGDPGFVDHAYRNGSRFTFANSVNYICNEGYILVGYATRFCQTDGKWSGKLPSCEKLTCAVPDNPVNGEALYLSLDYGAKLSYKCTKGYRLDNTESRECSANGEWNGNAPLCVESFCIRPVAPKHGSVDIVGGTPKVGTIVIFSCNGDKKLIGSTTSKCLSTGEWTFPVPQCVEPCTIPFIENGVIGLYEKQWRRKQFKVSAIGKSVEVGQDMYLRCEKNYEVTGELISERKISCRNGNWDVELQCIPASCRSDPPLVENAHSITLEREHGTVITYLCHSDYKKVTTGAVKCNFGSWKGKQPVCKDTRCYVRHFANLPGLERGRKLQYRDGESFTPQCIGNYELSQKDNNKLTCVNGQWEGHFPPCKAAPCRLPPPIPENGVVKEYSGEHSTDVKYECNTWYHMELSSVTCQLGEWHGQAPVCKDTRCYLKDLRKNDGVNLLLNNVTHSSEYPNIMCKDGYTLKHAIPKCSNGIWQTQNSHSPCQPSQCLVTEVTNGDIGYLIIEETYSIFGYKKDRRDVFKKVNIGSRYNHETELYVSCTSPYIFQGRDLAKHIRIQCKFGKWDPVPVCLKSGTEFKAEIVTTSLKSQFLDFSSTTSIPQAINEADVSNIKTEYESEDAYKTDQEAKRKLGVSEQDIYKQNQSFPSGFTGNSIVNVTDQPSLDINNNNNNNTCVCHYNLKDENVRAVSGNKYLKFGAKVRNGCVVKFYCAYIGYHRLIGRRELKCIDCHWHSSEFPSCVKPGDGDSFIQISATVPVNALSSGKLIVVSGAQIYMECGIRNTNEYPEWLVIFYDDLTYSCKKDESDVVTLYSTVTINNIQPFHSGRYICKSKVGYSSEVEIIVKDIICPFILLNDSDVIVTYDGERKFDSEARFSCVDKDKVVIGPERVTCLVTQKWSADPPQCDYVKCPVLPESEMLTVSYIPDRTVNSRATFHCLSPAVRHGTSYVNCLPNGSWSGPIPSCILVNCSIDSLFEILPQGVVPNNREVTGESVPYGTVLNLLCDHLNLRIMGAKTAKCGITEKWEVEKVLCVPGCPPVEKAEGSDVLIYPVKESYRFGEFVVFSCPPGRVLTIDVVRIMCLQGGWSENVLPDCYDIKL